MKKNIIIGDFYSILLATVRIIKILFNSYILFVKKANNYRC